jgi:hypothetical protein
MNKLKTLLIFVTILTSSSVFAQKKVFSKGEIISDLAFLKINLEQNHPNLYTYSSKEDIDKWFEEQSSQLPDSLTYKEAFAIISSISDVLQDGHSYIYPSAEHLNAFFSTAPLFPLDVFMLEDQLIVVQDHSDEQSIPMGATLRKINGVEVDKIQSLIIEHTCRDGGNKEYAKHLCYQFFPAYYSYFFGFPSEFKIEYEDKSGEYKKVVVQGLKRENIKSKRKNEQKKGIELQLLPDHKSAILIIKSFDKTILKDDYNQKFKKEVKTAFQTLLDKNIENLAIDLRDNQGGALSNGIYLLQHFMNTAFQCVHSYYVLKGGKKKKLKTKWDNFFKPKKENHFKGNVYLFINGGSYSCSAIVANTFKENRRGVVLGQMTGGSAYVNSGGPNESIVLPNSKILFTIPKTQYNLRKDLSKIGLGVIPDISVQDHPDRIIHKKDSYLEAFEELIKK